LAGVAGLFAPALLEAVFVDLGQRAGDLVGAAIQLVVRKRPPGDLDRDAVGVLLDLFFEALDERLLDFGFFETFESVGRLDVAVFGGDEGRQGQKALLRIGNDAFQDSLEMGQEPGDGALLVAIGVERCVEVDTVRAFGSDQGQVEAAANLRRAHQGFSEWSRFQAGK